MREPGFYWVRGWADETPIVGEYVAEPKGDGFWWLPGYAGEQTPEEITVLSERLLPPDWDKGPPLKSEA